MNKILLLEKLQQAKKLLNDYPVDMLYLFGSQAYNQATPLSDIDIALVISDDIPIKHYINLELELEVKLNQLLGSDKIDCRAINHAPLSFQGRVIKDGCLIYSRDENRRVDFETLTLQKYFDFLPRFKHLTKSALLHMQQEGLLGQPGKNPNHT